MKFILAPDSFKNALAASDVAHAIARGIHSLHPDASCVELPLADGGEGTVAAIARAIHAPMQYVKVSGPLGKKVDAGFVALPDGSAVIEVAAAAGIELLSREELNPLLASSVGVGEMLHSLLKAGYRSFIIGLGGSATVDGGIGVLQALGATFFCADGTAIPYGAGGGMLERITRIDLSTLMPELENARFRIASDVTNPLIGEFGAAAVFAPQKGATPAMVMQLERGLRNWAALWNSQGDSPGDGAAGGLGFAFRHILGGGMQSGAELVLEAVHFDAQAADANWIITGEGRTDTQSLHGKLCSIVALHGKKLGIPVILLSGALQYDAEEWQKLFAASFSIAAGPGDLKEAITQTEQNLFRMGRNIAALTIPKR